MKFKDLGEVRQKIKYAADEIVKIKQKVEASRFLNKTIGSEGSVSFESDEYIQRSSTEEIEVQTAIILEGAKEIIENGMPYSELLESYFNLLAGIPARKKVDELSANNKQENYDALAAIYSEIIRALTENETDLLRSNE